MRRSSIIGLATLGAALLSAWGCGGGSSGINLRQGAVYQQIERFGRPAVKEAFEAYDNHDTTNRSTPTNDPLLPNDIYNFTISVAGRSPAFATTLKTVLTPDEMVADLSQRLPTAAYLGVETKGLTGSLFGGRALNDDVIDISLGAIFGKTLTLLGVPDDGHESPCLTTDNVGPAQTYAATFPYLNSPY